LTTGCQRNVRERYPLKQGLKHQKQARSKRPNWQVEEEHPLKQGKKRYKNDPFILEEPEAPGIFLPLLAFNRMALLLNASNL